MPFTSGQITVPTTPVNTVPHEILEALVTFLTTGLGAGNNWTLLANTTNSYTEDGDVYLRAPGPQDNDAVFVNIQVESDIPNDEYSWILQGAVGHNAGVIITDPGPNDLSLQPGAIPNTRNYPRILFANETTNYWFYANKSRFVVITQGAGGQVFESCYCGFFNSYGAPSDYPVPLLIGGMDTVNGNPSGRLATNNAQHSWWLHHVDDINNNLDNTLYLRSPSGFWNFSDYLNTILAASLESDLLRPDRVHIHPIGFQNPVHTITVSEDPALEFIKYPTKVITTEGGFGPQALGELDGIIVFPRVQGIGPNDVLQELGPIDYRVFPNANRVDNRSLFGILEA